MQLRAFLLLTLSLCINHSAFCNSDLLNMNFNIYIDGPLFFNHNIPLTATLTSGGKIQLSTSSENSKISAHIDQLNSVLTVISENENFAELAEACENLEPASEDAELGDFEADIGLFDGPEETAQEIGETFAELGIEMAKAIVDYLSNAKVKRDSITSNKRSDGGNETDGPTFCGTSCGPGIEPLAPLP